MAGATTAVVITLTRTSPLPRRCVGEQILQGLGGRLISSPPVGVADVGVTASELDSAC
jgi:hypothetical protein